jgi:hypothetical protein
MKSDTSDSGSRWLWFALSASTVALVLERLFGRMFTDPDVPFYLDIAKGNMAAVLQPFAARQLHPHLARWLADIFHLSLHSGFIAEQVISLFVLTAALGWLLDSMGAGRRLLLAVAGTSFWAAMFNGVGLPDLWFSALLGLFLVLLYRQKWLAAAAMLFLMFLSRESTVLVLVCLLISAWRELRVSGRIVALSASAAGMLVVHSLIPAGMQNRERLGTLAYMAGKIPWNFLKNIVGIPPWNNLNQNNCASPRWSVPVHLGAMHLVGLCSYNPIPPLTTLRFALSSFGLFPLLLVFVWRRRNRQPGSDSVILRFSLIYGLASLLLAPELGSSVARLIDYAWPLFFVALPLLLVSSGMNPLHSTALTGLHLAVSWSIALGTTAVSERNFDICLILIICAAYAGAWMLLRSASARYPGEARAASDQPK